MEYTTEEVLKYIEEEDVRFIRLAFRDAFGVQKNIAVMPGEVKKAFEEGIPINARAIAGFADSPYASLYLKPDPATLTILPWRSESGKVLRMFCDVCTPGGEAYASDTREILKKARLNGAFPHVGEAVDDPYWDLEQRCDDLYGLFAVSPTPAGGESKRRVYIHKEETHL